MLRQDKSIRLQGPEEWGSTRPQQLHPPGFKWATGRQDSASLKDLGINSRRHDGFVGGL